MKFRRRRRLSRDVDDDDVFYARVCVGKIKKTFSKTNLNQHTRLDIWHLNNLFLPTRARLQPVSRSQTVVKVTYAYATRIGGAYNLKEIGIGRVCSLLLLSDR